MEKNNIEKKLLTLKDLTKSEHQNTRHLKNCHLSHVPIHLSSCACLLAKTKKDETS